MLNNTITSVITTYVVQAFERTTDEQPYVSPLSGGSLPDSAFARDLQWPLVKVPYTNADEANHAPNESLELTRFYDGVKIGASVYEALAREEP